MRTVRHVIVGIASWVVFAALWALLARQGRVSPDALRDTGTQLAVLGGAVLALTTWWVRHNVGIHRRKGPRTGVPTARPRTDQDRLGRPVRWALPGADTGAQTAQHVVVDVEDGAKTYRREAPRP